ncbi:ATP-binding protein [Candidatus Bipolaricaulota bacterium]
MDPMGSVDEVMRAKNCVRVFEITEGLRSVSYWQPERRVEILVSICGESLLVKGMKKYLVRGQSENGRTFVRDLPRLLTYMDDHFPEAHLYLGFFRDISPELVPVHDDAKRLADRRVEALNRHATLKDEIEQRAILAKHASGRKGSQRLATLLRQQAAALEAEDSHLRSEIQAATERLGRYHELISQYTADGRATVLAFGYSTALYQSSMTELARTVEAVIDDLQNTHFRSIRQKLEGGQLQVYIEELRFPWLMYSAEIVGAFSPTQLARLAGAGSDEALAQLERDVRSMFILTTAEDIDVAGYREAAARIPAQAFREFLTKVQVVPPAGKITVSAEGIWVGHAVHGGGREPVPFFLPLDKLINAYCSGVSGSGKSFFARAVAEGAIAEGVNVVVLDPSDQWAGLAFPADRAAVLELYEAFGMEPSSARGFPVDYYAPGASPAVPLPPLARLRGKDVIISFRQMSKAECCRQAAEILTSLFDHHSRAESERLKTLVIIDEAHRFTRTPKESAEESAAAAAAESAVDLIAREGRKYGLNVFLISQTIRDFSHSAATVRLNTNTKIFLRNSDIELDYAREYVPDVEQIVTLKRGEAIVCNADLGNAVKITVRPPFSKVGDVSPEQFAELSGVPSANRGPSSQADLSELEEQFLRLVREHLRDSGEPIILSRAMDELGVSSGRRQMALVNTLERRGLIYSEKLKARGNPRLIYPSEE